MDIGIWGMGRMGYNMARRLVDKGDHRVIAGNRSWPRRSVSRFVRDPTGSSG